MPRKEVRTYIDTDIREQWEAKFRYSSISWLLETAMRETLALVQGDPSLEERVREAIHQHILKNQPARANVVVASIP